MVCDDLAVPEEPPSEPHDRTAAPAPRRVLESPDLAASATPGRATDLPLAQGAVASVLCGILGFGCLGIILGPVAIYLGYRARVRVEESSGTLRGSTMALVGMCLGAVAFVVTVAVIIALVAGASSGSARPH
jgi:Domain of unknown function (DUF4190)